MWNSWTVKLHPRLLGLILSLIGVELFGFQVIAHSLEPLGDEAITEHISTLPGWRLDNRSLICTYEFDNFVESVAFINELVEPSEDAGHHPDLAIAYNRVVVSLTTHDVGGLTMKDFDLAEKIVAISERHCLTN